MKTDPPGPRGLTDDTDSKPVIERVKRMEAAKWTVVTDRVQLDEDTVVQRDVVLHPGAVGIVAIDDDERVVMLRQYRHPVAGHLWEIPAGLLDEPGESPLVTAQRELVEEVGLVAGEWFRVVDLHSSPGMSSETIRVFLARGLSDVDPGLRPPPTDEERDLLVVKVSLDDAVQHVLHGQIKNSLAVAALLAVAESRRGRWRSLGSPEHPWPAPSWGLG